MWYFCDLADERRAAKTGLPQSDKDVSEGRVRLAEFRGVNPCIAMKDGEIIRQKYPACAMHGAMNAVNREATLWRCSECGVGCEFRGWIQT